jgi:hypothetical protein
MDLTETIMRKWRKQAVFYRYKDGDKFNAIAKNLQQVTLKEALVNFNTWVCDWDMDLTDNEIAVVNNSAWRYAIVQRL